MKQKYIFHLKIYIFFLSCLVLKTDTLGLIPSVGSQKVLHPSVCIEKELDILSQSMTVNRSQFSRDVKNIPVNLSRSTDISIKISPIPMFSYVEWS